MLSVHIPGTMMVEVQVAASRCLETVSLPLADLVPERPDWWPWSQDQGVAEPLPGGVVAWELPRIYGNRRTLICNLGVGVGWSSGSQGFLHSCGRKTPIASFLLVLGTGAEQRLFLVQTEVMGKGPAELLGSCQGELRLQWAQRPGWQPGQGGMQ